MRRISPTQLQFIAGILVTTLGAAVLLGWITRNSVLIQIRPQFVAMVINTALCFTLLGIALLSSRFFNPSRKRTVQRLVGWVVLGLASLVLLEIIFRIDLGIDWREAHLWLRDGNPQPGRMAPNTALGFFLAGLTLVLMQNVRHKATGVAIQITTFMVLLLGLTGLVGYSLNLELLYAWFKATRMALPTAAGMIVVSLGLWSSWYRAPWFNSRQYFKDDEEIALIGVALF